MDSALLSFLKLLLIVLSLSSCASQATPVAPIQSPTATESSVVEVTPRIRYGMTAALLHWAPDSLRQSGLVLEEFNGTEPVENFDIVASYGTVDGWQKSPISHQVILIMNTAISPLDLPAVRALLVRGSGDNSEPENRVSVREELANSGYPDGISLRALVQPLPGIDTLRTQWADHNIRLDSSDLLDDPLAASDLEAQAHIIIAAFPSSILEEASTFSPDQEIAVLYEIPISYYSREVIDLTINADGIPLPAE